MNDFDIRYNSYREAVSCNRVRKQSAGERDIQNITGQVIISEPVGKASKKKNTKILLPQCVNRALFTK